MNISCIILSNCNYSQKKVLKKCITALRASASIAGICLNVYIVSSNPQGREMLLGFDPDNSLLVSENLGFSEMSNIAIAEILRFHSPDYILLINDDAWIANDFFARLETYTKATRSDILNPLIFEAYSQKLDSFGVEYFTSGYAKNNHSLLVSTTLATAACMLIRTDLLRKTKRVYGFYFNPIFYYYLEDVEFCIRARMIGAKIERFDKLIAYHIGSATSGKKSYFAMFHTYRNLLWIIVMTWPLKVIIRFLPSILIVQAWTCFYALIKFGPRLYVSIIIKTLLKLPALIANRNLIQSSYMKKISFSNIFSSYAFRTYHGYTLKI